MRCRQHVCSLRDERCCLCREWESRPDDGGAATPAQVEQVCTAFLPRPPVSDQRWQDLWRTVLPGNEDCCAASRPARGHPRCETGPRETRDPADYKLPVRYRVHATLAADRLPALD